MLSITAYHAGKDRIEPVQISQGNKRQIEENLQSWHHSRSKGLSTLTTSELAIMVILVCRMYRCSSENMTFS